MNGSYASFPRRLLAFVFDYFIIAFYLAALTLASTKFLPTKAAQSLFADPAIGQLSAFLILTLPVVLYFTLMESSHRRGTFGKRLLGMAVVTVEQKQLTRSRALARAALKFLPWELSHSCLWRIPGWPRAPQEPPWFVYAGFALVWVLVGIYITSMVKSSRRQSLYDRLTGCVVIRGGGISAV